MSWKQELRRVMNQLQSEYKQKLEDLKNDVRKVREEIVKRDKDNKDDSLEK
jgi:hypothetical protein